MMEIVRAGISDAEEILNIQKQAFIATAKLDGDMNIPPLTQTLPEIQADFQKFIFLKAVLGGRIIGSVKVSVENGTGYIGRLVVLDEFQNQGIGRALMYHIEEEFPEIKRFELFTGKSNEKNIYFYQKIGYTIFREMIYNERVKLVYMEKINMDKKDYTCKDLAEVRSNIDRIDREIVTLIAERSKYVAEAAKFKSDQLAVRDAKRVEQVIEKVTELAIEYDVDTRLIETIYRTMIAAFVEQEMKDYSKE